MSRIDIRDWSETTIDEIVFAEKESNLCHKQAFKIENVSPYVTICDDVDFVRISSKRHVENLIKALNKAIELGWFE